MHSKKSCTSKQVFAATMTSVSGKNGEFSNVFQSREHVVIRRGQIRRTGWVIKTLDALEGQSLLGCKCPVCRSIVVREQDKLDEFPAGIFLQNILQLHHQRWIILGVESLALWKIINEEDAVLTPKNWSEYFSSIFLDSEFFFCF
jgi:hypothetical protein